MGLHVRCCPLWCYVRWSVHGLVMFSPVFRERHVVHFGQFTGRPLRFAPAFLLSILEVVTG